MSYKYKYKQTHNTYIKQINTQLYKHNNTVTDVGNTKYNILTTIMIIIIIMWMFPILEQKF